MDAGLSLVRFNKCLLCIVASGSQVQNPSTVMHGPGSKVPLPQVNTLRRNSLTYYYAARITVLRWEHHAAAKLLGPVVYCTLKVRLLLLKFLYIWFYVT